MPKHPNLNDEIGEKGNQCYVKNVTKISPRFKNNYIRINLLTLQVVHSLKHARVIVLKVFSILLRRTSIFLHENFRVQDYVNSQRCY